jgi:arginine/lysine/ornithine decarboxylase
VAALRALAEHRAGAEPLPIPAVPHPAALRMPTVTSPREAFLGPTEMVPREDAAGRVCAEMICPYPPGVPVAAPGELLSAQALDYLGNVLGAGGVVQGAADRSLARVRVVAG